MCSICAKVDAVDMTKCIDCLESFCQECGTRAGEKCPYCLSHQNVLARNQELIDSEMNKLVSTQRDIDAEALLTNACTVLCNWCRKPISNNACITCNILYCACCGSELTASHVCDGESERLINATTKKCPSCFVRIEKPPDDCCQMYCVMCKTAWSWTTLKIIHDVSEIHNRHFFTVTDRIKKRFVDQKRDKLARAIYKSLKTLDRVDEYYAQDSYMNRLAYLNDEISISEFKRVVLSLRANYDRDIAVRNVLNCAWQNLDDDDKIREHHINLSRIDNVYSLHAPIRLPYC